jgi:hypothetical protein
MAVSRVNGGRGDRLVQAEVACGVGIVFVVVSVIVGMEILDRNKQRQLPCHSIALRDDILETRFLTATAGESGEPPMIGWPPENRYHPPRSPRPTKRTCDGGRDESLRRRAADTHVLERSFASRRYFAFYWTVMATELVASLKKGCFDLPFAGSCRPLMPAGKTAGRLQKNQRLPHVALRYGC